MQCEKVTWTIHTVTAERLAFGVIAMIGVSGLFADIANSLKTGERLWMTLELW